MYHTLWLIIQYGLSLYYCIKTGSGQGFVKASQVYNRFSKRFLLNFSMACSIFSKELKEPYVTVIELGIAIFPSSFILRLDAMQLATEGIFL